MPLKELVEDRKAITCQTEATVEDIASLMRNHEVGSVVVEKDGKPVGIITDRDLVLKCMCGDRSERVTANDLMTSPIVKVSQDDGIYDVVCQMSEKGVRRICVIDEDGKCLSVVSTGDIVELLAKEMVQLSQVLAPKSEKLVGKTKAA